VQCSVKFFEAVLNAIRAEIESWCRTVSVPLRDLLTVNWGAGCRIVRT